MSDYKKKISSAVAGFDNSRIRTPGGVLDCITGNQNQLTKDFYFLIIENEQQPHSHLMYAEKNVRNSDWRSQSNGDKVNAIKCVMACKMGKTARDSRRGTEKDQPR